MQRLNDKPETSTAFLPAVSARLGKSLLGLVLRRP